MIIHFDYNAIDNQEVDIRTELLQLLNTLPKRYRNAIIFRYGLEGGKAHTLDACSARLNVSRERVRQMIAKGLRKLRHPDNDIILERLFSEIGLDTYQNLC